MAKKVEVPPSIAGNSVFTALCARLGFEPSATTPELLAERAKLISPIKSRIPDEPEIITGKWIDWGGGDKCPVPAGMRFRVMFRNGRMTLSLRDPCLRWKHDGLGRDRSDIISYYIEEE